MRLKFVLLAFALLASTTACQRESTDPAPNARAEADQRVTALADTYLAGYFERYPDQSTYYGVPGHRHNRLPDNSLAAQKAWEAKEDAWSKEAASIREAEIQNGSLRATHAILREALDGAIGARACRSELWNVSQMTGWQVGFGYLVTIQPVGSDQARQDARARWEALPAYLSTEIANLREGLRLGYSAPKLNVNIVIGQIDGLLSSEADSPFLSPVTRDQDPSFQQGFRALYRQRIVPALRQYRDFLVREYLPAARETIAVTAHPDGAACYTASLRLFSTLPIEPDAVHETGRREIDRLTAEMRTIAERSFKTSDVPTLLQKLRADRPFLFKDRAELVAYSQAALGRAKQAMPQWFGLKPRADVAIEPYPKFREKNASNEYNPPAEDGSRPGLFYINAYEAEKKTRAPAESTAFHETIPGHHLQVAVALERRDGHPISRYILNSGFTEGWALYAERLADEMGLYSSDVDRLGMLSSQAFRAARLVIDSGLHTKGWTRQQAIDYMLAHTAEAPDDIVSEIDRYIIMPGQATAYMLGMLEIQKARLEAQQAMGGRFDIKAFHDRVLDDGAVPVTFLTSKIKRWAMISP